MKTIRQDPIEIERKSILRREGFRDDVSNFINYDCRIQASTESDSVIYMDASKWLDLKPLRWVVKRLKYNKQPRIRGLVTTSRTFGYIPRRARFQDYCFSSSTGVEPKHEYILRSYATQLERIYRDFFPETYAHHKKIVEENVLPEWRIKDSIFTGGIVNQNNQLNYHTDTGNFKNCFSMMLVLKRNMDGGNFVVPAYDACFDAGDSTLLMFNGQKFLHAVTPFLRQDPTAYRYTIVYYSLQQLSHCLPHDEELQRVRKVKLKREIKRASQ